MCAPETKSQLELLNRKQGEQSVTAAKRLQLIKKHVTSPRPFDPICKDRIVTLIRRSMNQHARLTQTKKPIYYLHRVRARVRARVSTEYRTRLRVMIRVRVSLRLMVHSGRG